jgi:hypothetical protein
MDIASHEVLRKALREFDGALMIRILAFPLNAHDRLKLGK